MHALHCILARLPDGAAGTDPEELKAEARSVAMSETEYYYEDVFDWRTEEDAGRWADEFPGQGVVLGLEEPERFRELLIRFKDRPLEMALEELRWLLVEDVGWRSQKELEADSDLTELCAFVPPPEPDQVFSGRFKGRAVEVDENLLRQIWYAQTDHLLAYRLQKALRLADGEYLFDSHFYSVPDASARISEATLQDALAHPEQYALVFSDYHF